MSTISDGVTTVTPTLVLGYRAGQRSRNVLIEPIDSPDPYVSLAAAQTRAGTWSYLFADEAEAEACRALHAAGSVLTLTDPDVSTVGMDYVVPDDGEIVVELDPETRKAWIVEVDFREV